MLIKRRSSLLYLSKIALPFVFGFNTGVTAQADDQLSLENFEILTPKLSESDLRQLDSIGNPEFPSVPTATETPPPTLSPTATETPPPTLSPTPTQTPPLPSPPPPPNSGALPYVEVAPCLVRTVSGVVDLGAMQCIEAPVHSLLRNVTPSGWLEASWIYVIGGNIYNTINVFRAYVEPVYNRLYSPRTGATLYRVCGCVRWPNSGCFTPETEILLADGTYRAIDDLSAGDEVLNPLSNEAVKIEKIIESPEKSPLISIVYGEEEFELKVTQTHPVLTLDGIKQAKNLTLSDLVRTKDGYAAIKGLSEVAVEPGQRVINIALVSNAAVATTNLVLAGGEHGIVTGDLVEQLKLAQEKD